MKSKIDRLQLKIEIKILILISIVNQITHEI